MMHQLDLFDAEDQAPSPPPEPAATDAGAVRSLTELPDIVDIVLEMAILDPLHVLPHLPAHLAKLVDRVRGYVEAASSANTRRPTGHKSVHRRCASNKSPAPRRACRCPWHRTAPFARRSYPEFRHWPAGLPPANRS
jgi:hypothetical protein